MKKKISIIVLIGLLFFICYSCFDIHCHNYKIIGVSLQKIYLEGDTSKENYMLTFNIKYCNGELQFLRSPLPPGERGSIDKIVSLDIFDSAGNNITSQFSPNSYFSNQERIIEIINAEKADTIAAIAKSGKSVLDIINSINLNSDSNRAFRIETARILKVHDIKHAPQSMKVLFDTRQVRGVVNNSPYKVYEIR